MSADRRAPGRLPAGVHAQVVAADDRPQARRAPVHGLDHVLLLRGRCRGDDHAAGADDAPGRRAASPDAYNRLFTMHGVIMIFFFLIPSIPAVLGNFLIPLMIGARDLAFPKLNLLSWYVYMLGGLIGIWILIFGGRRHRLDVLHAVQHDVLQHHGRHRGGGGVRHGVLVDPHRAQLHRDGAHDAGAGDDLVPPAALRLVALRDQPDHGAGNAGAGHLRGADRARAALRGRHLRPGPGRRPDPVPAPVLVLLAPGGLHHGPAGHGGDQRDHPLLLAQADLRLQVHRLRQHRDRGPRLPGLGPPHVRLRAVDVRGHGLLDPQLPGRHPVGHQGLQLDGDPVQGLDPVRHPDALRAGVHRPVHDRRPDRPDARVAGASTCTCTTPTSSSRISITSWSAGR